MYPVHVHLQAKDIHDICPKQLLQLVLDSIVNSNVYIAETSLQLLQHQQIAKWRAEITANLSM